MLLFKTSGETLDSVVQNKKHALVHKPKDWMKNEILLVSKNKSDCKRNEKQITHVMYLNTIEKKDEAYIKKYWPNSDKRWNYLVTCHAVIKLSKPFNLSDVLGTEDYKFYNPSMKPQKITDKDEKKILSYLKEINAI
jgi:hypothetical protein